MSGDKTGILSIGTPEGIVFSMPLAGPVTRFLAWGIDFAVVLAASTLASALLRTTALISIDLSGALVIVAYFLISTGYGMAAEWFWRGQTLGKRLLNLRVIDVHGLRLQFSQIAIRNLLRMVDCLPVFYLVGGASCFISPRAQRLGDLAANTVVVRNPKVADPDLNQLLADKYNSLRAYPHLAARLRRSVSPRESGIALQALMRRNELDHQARLELFGEISRHLRSIVAFPEEALHAMTDEQYVRNVVDILFNAKTPGETNAR